MGIRSASASADMVRVLVKYASAIGVSLEGVYEATGSLPQKREETEARISIEQFSAIWKEIAFRVDDRDFGLHCAETMHSFPGGDVVSAVMMNCPTVGSAIEKLAQYHDLTMDFVQLCLNEQGSYAYLSWEPIYPDVSVDRHHSEAVLATLALTLRDLTEGKIRLDETRFRHPQPGDIAEHRRIFVCPLAFEQPSNELVIRRQDLALPIFLASPELLERLEQIAQELLDRLYAPDTWADKVTHLVGRMLSRGDRPTLERIAYELAISTRHLQNKLKAEGTTYRRLCDQVRREIAVDHLQRQDMAICDIAFLLGFSEQSAFNHAFKRWTGSTPREYRTQGQSSTSPA